MGYGKKSSSIIKIDNTTLSAQLSDIMYLAPKPNGVDDTVSLNNAILNAKNSGYTQVKIPNGTYNIKAHSDVAPSGDRFLFDDGGIALLDGITLIMDKNTVLKAIPNDKKAYNVIRVYNKKNVSIIGGTVLGERTQHIGTIGEFGYGIAISGGENIAVRDTVIKDCWGDGINIQVYYTDPANVIYTPAKNVTIDNVICDNNRRQGCSVEGLLIGTIKNSIFRNTNGAAPQAGIDLEPFSIGTNLYNPAQNIVIDGNTFENNLGAGVLLAGNTGENVSDIKVINNTLTNNSTNGGQIELHNCNRIIVSNNIMKSSPKYAVWYVGGFDVNIEGNTVDKHVYIKTDKIGVENVFISSNNIKMSSIADAIAIQPNVKNVTISKNTIIAMETTSDTGSGVSTNGIFTKIKDNYIIGFSRGIKCDTSSSHSDIVNNNIMDCGIIALTLASHYSNVMGNTFSGSCWNNNNQPTIFVNTSSYHIIKNNKFIQSVVSGVTSRGTGVSNRVLSFGATLCENSVFQDNTIIGTSYPLYFEADRPSLKCVIRNENSFMTGTTAQRPTSFLGNGFMYRDTTLNKVITYNGTAWVDMNGTAV